MTNEQDLMYRGVICPYCRKPTIYTDSKIVYGVSYGMIYLCFDCDAYVGVHKGTSKALGRLANRELRALKQEAHRLFDVHWLNAKNKRKKRTEMYKWMSEILDTPLEYTHIGFFKKDTLEKLINLLENNKEFI